MVNRVLKPEILDNLLADDPRAIRSRRDLSRINVFMGNKRWLLRKVVSLAKSLGNSESSEELATRNLHVIEIGAGDGSFLELCQECLELMPEVDEWERSLESRFTGIDLIAKPEGMHDSIDWFQGDLFDMPSLPIVEGELSIVVCNLILHHFDTEQLGLLVDLLQQCDHVLAVEPYRSWFPKFMGYLAFPFINDVTRHDMIVSIEAGFRRGELAEFFKSKNVEEKVTRRGGLRTHLF